ncbi:MAG TPA: type II secretion system protein [Acidimicrobiales bacterium]|nr:type II secretion system protein [Acidimicrobiales bacterium]
MEDKLRLRTRQAGETLVEVLLGVLIIAITVSALLAALVTSITSSAEHRSLADLDTILRSAAETTKSDIELQSTGPWFANCASVTSTTYTDPSGPTTHAFVFSAPSGYTVSVTSIEYWDSTNNVFSNVTSSVCQTHAQYQSGYQLVTLAAVAPSGVTETLSIGVRSST